MRANMRTGNILMDTRSNTPTTITRNREETISPHQVDTSSPIKTYPQTTVVTPDGNSFSIGTIKSIYNGSRVFETFNGQTKAVDWTCKDLLTPPEETTPEEINQEEFCKELEFRLTTQQQRKRSASI
jgi:hypothetical protein